MLYVGDDFVQPQEYIYDAELNDEIIVKFETESNNENSERIRYQIIPLKDFKNFLSNASHYKKTFKLKKFNTTDPIGNCLKIEEKIIKIPSYDEIDSFNLESDDGTEPERIKSFMWVEFQLFFCENCYKRIKS